MSVKDEQISKLQAELQKKPLGERNLAVIKDADTMTKRAQNRILKTLEEPYEGTVIFLLSENRENIIDTVKSRCVIYRLESQGEKKRGTAGRRGGARGAVGQGRLLYGQDSSGKKYEEQRRRFCPS